MMKRLLTILAALALAFPAPAQIYHNADDLPLFGKITEDTAERYERLPAYLEGNIRDMLWTLGRHSAGLYIRFNTNSTEIWCRWTVKFGTHMAHQTLIGSRGVDLYALNDKDEWRFVAAAMPDRDSKESNYRIATCMDGKEREYMLYLPLYDSIDSLEIGIDSTAVLSLPKVDLPKAERPIVMYGTSILQGGCANRPGMASTGIIGRRLNRQVINLGFSGNAKVDLEIAEVMASAKDPSLFVFDYVPNASPEMIRERGEAFFRRVRDAHPDVPVLFLEDPYYSKYELMSNAREEVDTRNAAQRELFEKLKKQGEKKIWYLKSDDMVGHDNEAFVEGIHFTDLGMMRYAEWILPHIKRRMLK